MILKSRAVNATLQVVGANASVSNAWSLKAARAFCRRLAQSHYENFIVASFFLPHQLQQHFYNVYAYCRISDDLADEADNPNLGLELLDHWQGELQACYQGRAGHPVFIALSETIETFDIPMTPFADLLEAFKQDQTKRRYETFNELLDYCRHSANPVGHLVLYLCGYRDEERHRLSDSTCTALQLTNHWQDIARDLIQLNRIYLPREDMEQFGYSQEDLQAQICDERFRALMCLEVTRARELFDKGLRLCGLVAPHLAVDVEVFSRCGLEILRRIAAADYDVFRHRPTLSKWDGFRILAKCWWRTHLGAWRPMPGSRNWS